MRDMRDPEFSKLTNCWTEVLINFLAKLPPDYVNGSIICVV